MYNMERFIIGCLLFVGFGFSLNASACSTDGWTSVSGSVAAGSPTGTSRFEQLCGLAVTGTGYVQDNSPIDADDTRIRLRFYVLPVGGSGEITILRAYTTDAAGAEAFAVSFTPSTNIMTFKPFGASSVSTSALALAAARWHLVEIDWQAGTSLRFWVDASPNGSDNNPTGTAGAGTAAKVGMVRLGAPDGLNGATRLTFDSYQANRTSPVGGLLVGDANGGGTITSADAVRVLNEVSLGGTLSTGVPDCNLNGAINSSDAVCILAKIALP